jgi:hypothetical protein
MAGDVQATDTGSVDQKIAAKLQWMSPQPIAKIIPKSVRAVLLDSQTSKQGVHRRLAVGVGRSYGLREK